ncbi:MAG: hypothetical protein WBO43_16200 [Gemmatimonadota bacterium]|jgi:hypothetical protein
MKRFLIVGFILAAGAIAFAYMSFDSKVAAAGADTVSGEQPSPSEARQEAPLEDQERARRLTGRYLTVRGYNLRGEGWEHSDTLQAAVDSVLAERLLTPSPERRVCVALEAMTEGHRACMDDTSTHEGALFRVHIDAPENGDPSVPPGCEIKAIVIGFYSGLWSVPAVKDQRYKCIYCGEVMVCGSNPSCN